VTCNSSVVSVTGNGPEAQLSNPSVGRYIKTEFGAHTLWVLQNLYRVRELSGWSVNLVTHPHSCL
jgi:hypothetical protein